MGIIDRTVFKCDKCGEEYPAGDLYSSLALKLSVRNRGVRARINGSPDVEYKCDLCGLKCDNKRSLGQHRRRCK